MRSTHTDRRVVENVGAAYRSLRAAKILELFGQWISGLEPILLERIDVSPGILAQFALTHDPDAEPTIVNQIHWLELTE